MNLPYAFHVVVSAAKSTLALNEKGSNYHKKLKLAIQAVVDFVASVDDEMISGAGLANHGKKDKKEWPQHFNDLDVGVQPTTEEGLNTLIECAWSTLADMPHGCDAYVKLLAAINVSEKLHDKVFSFGASLYDADNKPKIPADPLTVKLSYLSQAILDVVEAKAISVKQHPPEDDDPYVDGELKEAAEAYLNSGESKYSPDVWPFALQDWVPMTSRGSLIQAVVFLIAEVERMDRVEAQTDYDACAPKAVAYEQPDSAFLLGTAKTMLKPVTFICPKCHQKKSIIDFAQSPKSKDGNCMLCWPHAPGVAMAEDEEDSL